MTHRLAVVLNVAFLALTVAVAAVPGAAPAWAQDGAGAPATEDVIYMTDGRELHGQVINETRSLVIFEYFDSTVNIKTKLTLLKEEIAHIERGVAVTDAVKADTAKPTVVSPAPASGGKSAASPDRTFGTNRAVGSAATVPSFYIVPMKGQMGTDINSEIYRKIVDDVKAMKPDVVVIKMFCQDTEDVLYSDKDERAEKGLLEWDEYRTLVGIFRNELREFRQVCWVEDSVGISSMVALAWPDIYMKPTARFGGLRVAHTNMFRIPDPDVRGKMVAALMGFVKSFLEYGGYSLVLADAMVRPDATLSATWKGREVIWSLDDHGEYLVDGNDKKTADFRAKGAEDLCISKGTAETLDDVALLLGYREFRVLDGQAEKICEDYVRDWRRAFEEIRGLLTDYEQFMGWASGQDTLKYLGRAKQTLEKILAYAERYKAVEIRLGIEYGLTKQDLIVMIETIKERIVAAKRAGGGTRGGSSPAKGGSNPTAPN